MMSTVMMATVMMATVMMATVMMATVMMATVMMATVMMAVVAISNYVMYYMTSCMAVTSKCWCKRTAEGNRINNGDAAK